MKLFLLKWLTKYHEILRHIGCQRKRPFRNISLFMHVPSQWETTLQCNGVSHWLGAYTKWSLDSHPYPWPKTLIVLINPEIASLCPDCIRVVSRFQIFRGKSPWISQKRRSLSTDKGAFNTNAIKHFVKCGRICPHPFQNLGGKLLILGESPHPLL